MSSPKKLHVKVSLVIAVLLTIMLATGSSSTAFAQSGPRVSYFVNAHRNDARAIDSLAQEQYDNRAYPGSFISYDQAIGSFNAYQRVVSSHAAAMNNQGNGWQLVGPTVGNVPGFNTYTGRATTVSGRVTSLAVSPTCDTNSCHVWVGSAGGGVWTTTHGLAQTPDWHSSSNGIPSNAIGSITLDPNDTTGATLYVGTGEPNGSADSEAGVGLYKSIDFGHSWTLVPGSIAAAKDRSIGSIAIDPNDPKHIYIGTDVARHGSSSVNGGRFSPPNAPTIGLYESTDGGTTFHLVFSKPSDVVNPGSPTGGDFFRGGVSKIEFNLIAGAASQIYFSVFDYGLFRSNNGSFEQVFASAGGGTVANSLASRTEFALAPNGKKLRIYLGDAGSGPADFYRVDDANVPASTLTDGTNNPGWIKLSNPNPGTPGFSSYNYCVGQCSYDMPVASPPGHPDNVWIGGQMQYSELSAFFNPNPPSNGRAVQRSTDAGVSFTDMTNDRESPPLGMHPDQHVIVFDPNNPDIAFIGSDGGVVRTSGTFVDASSDCNTRGLSGPDLTDCKLWLSAIPQQIFSLNAGLATLQFQSVVYNPQNPRKDLLGGTQDNGTWAYSGTPNSWFETVGGDGGQAVIDVGNPNVRMHEFTGASAGVNFHGTDPIAWDTTAGPLIASNEAVSFYAPLIGDPLVSGTMFVGLEHVWRTQDNGGAEPYLDHNCSENQPTFPLGCGDWVPLGSNLVDTTFGTDKLGSYVVAIRRAPSNTSTMWVGTRRGRLFISTNANAPAASVVFTRIDTAAQPTRFISGIAVDPNNPYHAFVSFSGYNAYTPNTPGHVFDVLYDPSTGTATWKDISYDLADQPITSVAYDSHTGNLYVATDFGVLKLEPQSTSWEPAASNLPPVAVYGLTLSESGHVLYAATHGRGIWRLNL